MKKKFIAAILLSSLCAIGISKATNIWWKTLVSETALAYNNTYVIDLDQQAPISRLSCSAVYSSATISAVTFTDGTPSTGTFTVTSVANYVATAATNTVTVSATSALLAVAATDYITVTSTNGLTGSQLVITGPGIARIALVGGTDYAVSLPTTTATNIATAIGKIPGLRAQALSTVVYATAAVAGIGGNSFTLASSTQTSLTVHGASFAGGANPPLLNAVLTINGRAYRQGYVWKAADTSSGTATSIASFMNNLSGLKAQALGSVVYATATVAGTAGNSFTMSSNATVLTVAQANFSGGLDNAFVSINGTPLVRGTDWSVASTSSGTAKAISDAIMANSTLNQIVKSTWTTAGVVTATATTAGINYLMTAGPSSAISAAGMTGSVASAINLTTDKITSTGNGLTTALPVLYTKTAGTSPTPLSVNTTYYAIRIDGNTFQLATTSTGAVAGSAINISSMTQAGGGSFVLTPLGITGTAGFKYQQSNDNSNWFDISTTSVTFASPYTAGTLFSDLGTINARYVRVSAVAPTTGGMALTVVVNAKN